MKRKILAGIGLLSWETNGVAKAIKESHPLTFAQMDEGEFNTYIAFLLRQLGFKKSDCDTTYW